MRLITTLGELPQQSLGAILPHEHVFVDFRMPEHPSHGIALADEVIALIAPEFERIKAQGISAFVDCTPVGVGRRADLLLAVSQATQLPIVAPTGIYREPWVPRWALDASEDALCEWMRRELSEGIEQTGVRAGWVKLSAGDDGMSMCERRILRAAVRAAAPLNAIIGSHTVRGHVVREQLDEIERMGYSATRFIWIHASAEPDMAINLEMAKRGAWIEFDWIGSQDDTLFIERIARLLDAGFGQQLLLSQDRGWFDPAYPKGISPGYPKPYTYLFDDFLPKLRTAGVDDGTITQIVARNPFAAYAR